MAEVPKLSMTNKTQGDGKGLRHVLREQCHQSHKGKTRQLVSPQKKTKNYFISCRQQPYTLVRLPKLVKVGNVK